MTFEEKVDWLRQVFSNDEKVRDAAMAQRLPRPLFQSSEELGKAVDGASSGRPSRLGVWRGCYVGREGDYLTWEKGGGSDSTHAIVAELLNILGLPPGTKVEITVKEVS